MGKSLQIRGGERILSAGALVLARDKKAVSCRLKVAEPMTQVSGKGFRIQMSPRHEDSGFSQSLALSGMSEVLTF